jgi:hypothetical protein
MGTGRRRLQQACWLFARIVRDPGGPGYRSGSSGFGSRTAHALRGTILTRTDSGGETLSVWRLGSAYGAAFITNQWYPDRLNTVRHGLIGGSTRLGFDLAKNVIAEFWPDLKRKISRRNP